MRLDQSSSAYLCPQWQARNAPHTRSASAQCMLVHADGVLASLLRWSVVPPHTCRLIHRIQESASISPSRCHTLLRGAAAAGTTHLNQDVWPSPHQHIQGMAARATHTSFLQRLAAQLRVSAWLYGKLGWCVGRRGGGVTTMHGSSLGLPKTFIHAITARIH